jgi:hypothetical protein
MAGAVRRQVTLTQQEDERLQQRARELGMSEEAIIQEAVRQVLGNGVTHRAEAGRAEARQEWEQVMALMRSRAALPVSPEERAHGRGWTREEIYDERFDRFSG